MSELTTERVKEIRESCLRGDEIKIHTLELCDTLLTQIERNDNLETYEVEMQNHLGRMGVVLRKAGLWSPAMQAELDDLPPKKDIPTLKERAEKAEAALKQYEIDYKNVVCKAESDLKEKDDGWIDAETRCAMAEAKLDQCKKTLAVEQDLYMENMLQMQNRAERAEAECERLRKEMAEARETISSFMRATGGAE